MNNPRTRDDDQRSSVASQQEGSQHVNESNQQGDARTPDKRIGEVAYAERNTKKKSGESR